MNTAILQRIIETNKENTTLEIVKSPISNSYLENVILRDKQLAIMGPRVTADIQVEFKPAYDYFAKGLKVHDELEKVFIQEMDFEKADHVAEKLIQKLLANISKKNRDPHIFRRFFGTNTMDGVVNEVPHIISTLDHVYHVKGRAGTGKSTFMKKIANACINHGLDIELYQCSFDPNSIDMVLVPALNICLFDSTDPHAFDPVDLKREEIIDLYEIAVAPGTDEKYQDEIAELTREYKQFMKKGIQVLKQEGQKIMKDEEAIPLSVAELDEAVNQIQSTIDSN